MKIYQKSSDYIADYIAKNYNFSFKMDSDEDLPK